MDGTNARLGHSMDTLGKRIEVMRKKTEILLQNELHTLESELCAMEAGDERVDTGEHSSEDQRGAERPRRHLPDIPRGRRDHVTFSEPPMLNIYDESSIVGVEGGAADTGSRPLTSTPVVPTPNQPDKAQEISSKLADKAAFKQV